MNNNYNYKNIAKTDNLKTKSIISLTFLIAFNIGAWILAYSVFHNYPKMLMLCLVAYGFGLRHAVDADHIAAIDNVTRKFLYAKKRSVGVGFFFSIGHSTIVIIMSFLVALGTMYMKNHLTHFQDIGGLIGTSVSSVFLLIIALINFIIFFQTYKTFTEYKRNPSDTVDVNQMLEQRGVMAALFKPLFKFVTKSWHMYLVGFLFGLGFDTSTEVALLGISATQVSANMPVLMIMIFPILFMSGMSLIDTLDGVLMVNVYGWMLHKPDKKLFYNMMITLLSFSIAFFIGALEALSVISDQFDLQTGFWAYIGRISNNLNYLGFYIVGIFLLCWLSTMMFSKFAGVKTEEV